MNNMLYQFDKIIILYCVNNSPWR